MKRALIFATVLGMLGILFAVFAVPVFADNCDLTVNPLDCGNTAWAIGSIAALASALAGAAAAGGFLSDTRPPQQTKFEPVDPSQPPEEPTLDYTDGPRAAKIRASMRRKDTQMLRGGPDVEVTSGHVPTAADASNPPEQTDGGGGSAAGGEGSSGDAAGGGPALSPTSNWSQVVKDTADWASAHPDPLQEDPTGGGPTKAGQQAFQKKMQAYTKEYNQKIAELQKASDSVKAGIRSMQGPGASAGTPASAGGTSASAGGAPASVGGTPGGIDWSGMLKDTTDWLAAHPDPLEADPTGGGPTRAGQLAFQKAMAEYQAAVQQRIDMISSMPKPPPPPRSS